MSSHARCGLAVGRRQAIGDDPARDAGQDGAHGLVVGARNHGAVERHLVREVDEGLLEIGPAPVALHVLVVDVRNHGDRR